MVRPSSLSASSGVETEPLGPGMPLGCQRLGGYSVVLRLARGQGRHLRRGPGRLAAARQLRLDLDPPPGERPQHIAWDIGQLAQPVLPQREPQTQRAQLVPQRGLVQRAGRLGLPVQLPPVQRGPAAVLPAGHVRDQHMRVQLRVARPGGAMPERGRDEPAAGQPVHPVLAPAHLPGLPLQVAQRRGHRPVVRLTHQQRRPGVRQREQQRHTLRRGERQVEPGEPVLPSLPQQRPPVLGTPAVEHRPQVVPVDHPGQPEPRRPRSDPPAQRLPRAEVVVLHPLRDRIQVVALRATAQLADAQHESPGDHNAADSAPPVDVAAEVLAPTVLTGG